MPQLHTLHILTQGARLQVAGERVEIWHQGQRIATAPRHTLETLVIHGAVHLTAPAINHLLASGIRCIFLTTDGRLKGHLEPIGNPAARLRSRQAAHVVDPHRRLRTATLIARNKLHAQHRVLNAIRSPRATDLATLLPRLRQATTLDELRGLEGWATRLYFAAWRDHLRLIKWTRRQHPAPDPLNALLSYTYALLHRPAWEAIATAGLDPHQGFLHLPTRAQPALVLDLIEEFRAPLADITAFKLYATLRHRDDWWQAGPDGSTRLTPETRQSIIQRFESRLHRQTRYGPTGQRQQIRAFFHLQARAIARHIQVQGPLLPAW